MIQVAMTPEQFETAAAKLQQEQGLTLKGSQGVLSKAGVTASYAYDGATLTVMILKRPFLASLNYCESTLVKWLNMGAPTVNCGFFEPPWTGSTGARRGGSMKFRGLAVTTAIACMAICMGASGGCGTTLHKAEVASGAIAASLNTAASVNHTDALISAEERSTVATYIDAAAKSNDMFLGVLSAAENNGGTVDVPTLLAAFSQLSQDISNMETQGILHLKSAQAQADFSIAIAGLKAQLAVIESLYPQAVSKSQPVHQKPSRLPLFAIALTAEEIEELIAMAIAAGSALVPKLLALRGATDAELIADAKADDAQAESIAEQDEGTANQVTAQVPTSTGS